jgi:predicted transcriptional regulator
MSEFEKAYEEMEKFYSELNKFVEEYCSRTKAPKEFIWNILQGYKRKME